jgi:para-aminobenzoate synthetase component I
MPLDVSTSTDGTRFAALVGQLAESGQADLLLSSPGLPQASCCTIGWIPRDELCVEMATDGAAIERFCFADQDPVLGYLGYDYGVGLRGVCSDKSTQTRPGVLRKYAAYLEHDLASGASRVYGRDSSAVRELSRHLAAPVASPPYAPPAPAAVAASLTQVEYEDAVRRTLDRIRAGHTYQLNLSICFTRPAPDLHMARLLVHLWEHRPAAFYAYIRCGGHEFLSTSPERFLQVADGHVLSQPIKGTLAFESYSPDLVQHLRASAKESAELSMIVDLIRNDISHHCEYGSVQVARHKECFVVDSLVHMYSDVRGQLRHDRSCVDLLLDAFPGGSVTGCPKRRSMEIIDQLEPHTRGIYCGSVVLIRGPREMDSSIAIRTAWREADSGRLAFYAGSGIVIDSVPELEYQETMAKAEKFLTL